MIMKNDTADENERIFVEKCKSFHLELLNQKNTEPMKIPQYERD